MKDASLADALQNLSFAIKSLQLYPPTSPLVRGAIERCYASLVPLLATSGLTLEVMPRAIRHGDIEIGPGRALVEQLARRLHGHGVARLHLDTRVEAASLQRLAELVAADRRRLEEQGSFDAAFNEDRPTGIRADFLELERLFDGDASTSTEDIWEALLDGFRLAENIEEIDWNELAQNLDRLQDFVAWVGDNVDQIAERTGYENVDVFRFVLDRIGGIAASLGTENVNFLVLAVRRIFDQIDPDLLVDLLAEPLEIEAPEHPPETPEAAKMSLSAFLGEGQSDDPLRPEVGDGERRKTIDVTQLIACGLDPEQTEELILHTMRGNEKSSTRLYGLFSRLMEGREERLPVAQRVGTFLEREIAESGDAGNFLDVWPRVSDVLAGEASERFVSSGYEMAMQRLLADDSLGGAWPIDRIGPRVAEMNERFIGQRKALVLIDVLEIEDDDDAYADMATELEGMLRESVADDQFGTALHVLRAFRRHAAGDSGRSEAQRQRATEVGRRFYDPSALRELLNDSLGRVRHGTDAVSEILDLGGPEIVPPLLDLLADEESRRVRQRLLKILAGLGEPVAETSAQRLGDKRWYVLRNLVLLLGDCGDDARTVQIAPLLRHDDARVRSQVVQAIIKLGGGDSAELLLAATDDENAGVRVLAVHGLGFHRSDDGIEKLRGLLHVSNFKGENTPTIQAAVIALGRLGDKPSEPRLARLSKSPWFYVEQRNPVREAARWAILAVHGEQAGAPPEPRGLRRLRPGRSGR